MNNQTYSNGKLIHDHMEKLLPKTFNRREKIGDTNEQIKSSDEHCDEDDEIC